MLIGWLAPTHALVCKSQLTETQASVDNFQQRMKIALARGDLTTIFVAVLLVKELYKSV
jgi:hypothetical protein